MATSQNLIPLPMLRSALGDFTFDVWAYLLETRGGDGHASVQHTNLPSTTGLSEATDNQIRYAVARLQEVGLVGPGFRGAGNNSREIFGTVLTAGHGQHVIVPARTLAFVQHSVICSKNSKGKRASNGIHEFSECPYLHLK